MDPRPLTAADLPEDLRVHLSIETIRLSFAESFALIGDPSFNTTDSDPPG